MHAAVNSENIQTFWAHVDKRLTDDTLGWNEQNVNQIGTQLKANFMDVKRR